MSISFEPQMVSEILARRTKREKGKKEFGSGLMAIRILARRTKREKGKKGIRIGLVVRVLNHKDAKAQRDITKKISENLSNP